jgi:hypothetical protein
MKLSSSMSARDNSRPSPIINANLARALYWSRRYDEAIAQARRTLGLDPKYGLVLSGWKVRFVTGKCSAKQWHCGKP